MKNYEVNENTLALISEDENTTIVYETTNKFLVNKNANKIMEDSCEYFGSSLDGRQKGTSSLIGITHKVPIIIEETKEIIFFPTASPRLKNCSWLSLKNIEDYFFSDNKVFIKFRNNQLISLNLSFGIIDNQVLRATRLESVLRKRKML